MPEVKTENRKRRSWYKRLTNKYRLVLLNDLTFEEVTSFKLTRMNVYVLISSILVIFVLIILAAIIYTPLKEYIPGYADVNLRRDVMELKLRGDSLERVLHSNSLYLQNIKQVISGQVAVTEISDTTNSTKTPGYDSINLDKVSSSEKEFRKDVEKEERFTVSNTSSLIKNKTNVKAFHFFQPIKGYITEPFNLTEQHYGVDIVAPVNEPIKATLDGIVVFAAWTSETGYVMAIQHNNNLISLYKHNSVLLKEEGNYVKAGDVIAIIGNTGELTSGPHLHFELWYNGLSLNPEDYIVFK
ncbi:MAG: M23 family metallopeptidase [Chitinophagales bacterium]|jgi:murein DD-endopeptidase MepM/ murein hydrolase activator NlpD|nr:M23 family metallopeptidase [Chitinophagales bacterium]